MRYPTRIKGRDTLFRDRELKLGSLELFVELKIVTSSMFNSIKSNTTQHKVANVEHAVKINLTVITVCETSFFDY